MKNDIDSTANDTQRCSQVSKKAEIVIEMNTTVCRPTHDLRRSM